MADEIPSGSIGKLIDHLFTGTASDAVIAVLVLVVVALGYALWQVYKRLLASEQERAKISDDHAKALKDLNKEYQDTLKGIAKEYQDALKEVNSSYQESLHQFATQNAASSGDVSRAMQSVQVTIAELKTIVSILGTRGSGHGAP